MSEKKENFTIDEFLEGLNDKKYVVGIESDYMENEVSLIIDDPNEGYKIETHTYTPFLFMKKLGANNSFYRGDKNLLNESIAKNGIKVTPLRTDNEPRLVDGYSYLVESSKKQINLNNFFKSGGIIGDENGRNDLIAKNKPLEQFLMSTGIRLFKGFDTYNDIHKLYFDIETTSLKPEDGNIFLIGIKTNRGYRRVLEIDLNNPIESERKMIIDFFNIIMELKPNIISGYNSEAFDFYYILGRAKILNINFYSKDFDGNPYFDVRTSLNSDKPIKRQPSTIKFGGETENYEKTIMWGFNVVDIAHAVRATKAINSEIKSWGLKYITKYAKANKENRMYVEGNSIYKIWFENKKYFINTKNNSYRVIPEKYQDNAENYIQLLKGWVEGVKNSEDKTDIKPQLKRLHDMFDGDINNIGLISGKDIVFQYLLDDLDETEIVDEKFSQSNFMIGKIMPTDYSRAITMGNSSKWKLLLSTYHYLTKVAIPINVPKRDIVGGLSRLLELGFAKNVLKMDYSSLYPSIQISDDVFPSFDITGVLKTMLNYFRDSRNENKALSKKYEKLYQVTKDKNDDKLAKLYDTKQLPVKILNNSQFGAISAPNIFNWGDNNIGCQITCTGRQFLRLMVWHFGKYGFKALVLDTDGVNFSMPDGYENLKYTAKDGKEYSGYEAVLEEFNDLYMYSAMKLSLDGLYTATINISRKNYIDLYTDGSYKLVGNSLKSSTLPMYIEETLNEVVQYLVKGDGKSFIEAYYKKLSEIYNMQVPLIKIASKAKVKEKVSDYEKDILTKVNKAGRAMSRKAHMELLIEHGLTPDLGTDVYYVNNGTAKSHGDVGHSYLIDINDYINEPEKTGIYNFKRAVDSFNKRMEIFLVCFKEKVRESLIVANPSKRGYYSDEEMELVSGIPMEAKDQDCLTIDTWTEDMKNEPLMEMSEREVIFWNQINKDPREIFEHFTTALSREHLLTKDEKIQRDKEFITIKETLLTEGVVVKNELDYIKNGDIILRYSKLSNRMEEVFDEKIGMYIKKLVTVELPEMRWLLTEDNNNVRIDIKEIPTSFYRNEE